MANANVKLKFEAEMSQTSLKKMHSQVKEEFNKKPIKVDFNIKPDKMAKLESSVANMTKRAQIKLKELKPIIKNSAFNDLQKQLNDINNTPLNLRKDALRNWNTAAKEASVTSKDLGKSIANNAKKFTSWITASTIVMQLIKALKAMLLIVVQLDKAFTDIQMVTGYNNDQIKNLKESYTKLAQQLHTTTQEVAEGANEWLRQGMSIEDTNKALEASIIFSKVAGTTNAEATKLLTSAMKGYGLEASNLLDIVDKLNAVDMAAAVSASDLATAMSETAASANLSGVSMDVLLGYLGAVQEVTQDSAESIGNSFKTIFARMQSVKIGSLEDAEGEDVSNVEKVLKQYDVTLRNVNGTFRSTETVLDEVAGKWAKFTNAQKSEIATTIAGVRQREKFLVLMENYDKAMELSEEAIDSAGISMDKFGIYADSIDAKVNNLKSTFEEMAQGFIKSDFVKGLLDIIKFVGELINNIGGIKTLLISTIGLITLFKGKKILEFLATAFESLKNIKLAAGGVTIGLMALFLVINGIRDARAKNLEIINEEIETTETEIDDIKKLRDEYSSLMAITDRTSKQEARLTEIKNKLAEAQEKYNDALKNGTDTSEDYYKSSLQAEADAQAKLASSLKARAESLEKDFSAYEFGDVTKMIGQMIGGIFSGDRSLDVDAKLLIKQYKDIYGSYIDVYNKMLNEYQSLGEKGKLSKDEKTQYGNLRRAIGMMSEYADAYSKYADAQSKLKYLQSNISNIAELQSKYDEFVASGIAVQKESADVLLRDIKYFEDLASKSPELKNEIDDLIGKMKTAVETALETDLISQQLAKVTSELTAQQNAWKEEQEALEKIEKLQSKILAVEEAREALAEAKRKKARIYREGVGFVYESDFSEVQSAQDKLAEAENALKEYKQEIYFEEELEKIAELDEAWQSLFLNNQQLKDWVNQNATLYDYEVNNFADMVERIKKIAKDAGIDLSGESISDILNMDTNKDSVETHHNGGIVGEGATFTSGTLKDNERITKLQKGELVLTKFQQSNLAAQLKSGSSSGGGSISIGNITLPNVTNASQFVNEIKAISRTSLQTVLSHR